MTHRGRNGNTQVRRLITLTLGGQIRAIRRPACPKPGSPPATVSFMPADREDARDKPVVLSRIYTRTGDGGTTAPRAGRRARQGDPPPAADRHGGQAHRPGRAAPPPGRP